MTEPNYDPILEELYRIREEHSARFNHDLKAMFEDLKDQERASGRTFAVSPVLQDGTRIQVPTNQVAPRQPVLFEPPA